MKIQLFMIDRQTKAQVSTQVAHDTTRHDTTRGLIPIGNIMCLSAAPRRVVTSTDN